MHTGYEAITQTQKIGHFIEESGECLAALGKVIRWGVDSFNPELPKEKQETNRAWFLREVGDLEIALLKLKFSFMNEVQKAGECVCQ